MLLAVVMALSLMPVSSFADEEDSGNEEIKIWVAGNKITETGEVTGAGITGTVSYDSDKNILTLDGATITAQEDSDGNKIAIRAEQDLKIELIGSNTIQAEDATKDNVGIGAYSVASGEGEEKSFYNLSIFGEEGASLEITAGDATQGNSFGIDVNELTLNSGTVTANAGNAVGENKKSIGVSVGKLIMENGTLTAKGETQAILAPDTIEENVYSEKIVTVATDTTSSLTPWDGSADLFTTESEFQQIKIEPSSTLYPIWVAGTQVSESNKNDVLGDGTVAFNGTDKLTLNGANIETDLYYGISSYIPLTIELIGKNLIKSGAETKKNDDDTNNYGICMFDEAINERVDLTITGEGKLKIELPNSEKEYNAGIVAKNLTINSTGELSIDSGKAKEESIGIAVSEKFEQNSGKIDVSGDSANESYGIDAKQIVLNDESVLFAAGKTRALVSQTIEVNVTDPSITASELYDSIFKPVKIQKENANELTGDDPIYRSVSIIAETKRKDNLSVRVEDVAGVTVTVKKSEEAEFKNSLEGLKEDDIIEVDVKVTDPKKELDKVWVYEEGKTPNDKDHKLVGKTFLVWKTDAKVKAVLKDKPVAPSTGGGGGGGGFTSQSSVRPGESTATTNDPKKDPKNDPAPNVAPEVKEVRLTIASKSMKKGNENVVMDAAPFIREGRTMVPLRYVAEALGLKVSWDAKTKTVTLSNDKNQIVVPTNSLTMQMNGEKVQSDVLPVLQGGRIYLSISNIGKALGLEQGKEIRWDAAEKTVILSVK